MYICSCSAVTESEIIDAIHNHDTKTVIDLINKVGVCAGCGTCEEELERIIDRERKKKRERNPELYQSLDKLVNALLQDDSD